MISQLKDFFGGNQHLKAIFCQFSSTILILLQFCGLFSNMLLIANEKYLRIFGVLEGQLFLLANEICILQKREYRVAFTVCSPP